MSKFLSVLSIFILLPFGADSFFLPAENFQKCGLEETLGVVMCIAPVTTLFQDQMNLQNVTRARGIRIVDECRNATTCLSQYPCVTKVQLDKVFGLLCDTVSYFSTDFADCQKKLVVQMPPCMREAEKTMRKSEKFDHPCELISKYQPCMQTEITNICGEKYWTPLEKILGKLQKYAHIKCPVIAPTEDF